MSKSRSNVDVLNSLIVALGGTDASTLAAVLGLAPDATDLSTLANLVTSGNTGLINIGGARLVNTPVADDQTLDYYKDTQSFTPTIAFGGASVGVTYSATNTEGRWVRIGGVVWFRVCISLTSKGASAGAVTVQSLPFASAASAGVAPGGVYAAFGLSLTAGVQPSIAVQNSGASTVTLYKGSTGGHTAMTDADVTNTSLLAFSGIYMV